MRTPRIGATLLAILATLLPSGASELAAQQSSPASSVPDSFAGTPLSHPTDQSLRRTLQQTDLKRREEANAAMAKPDAGAKAEPVDNGIILPPNSRIRFGGDASAKPPPAPAGKALSPADGVPAASANRKVRFRFENANVSAVVSFMARLYGLEPMLAPGVTQTMSVSTQGEIPLDRAFAIFTAVMDNIGCSVVVEGGFLRAIRKGDASHYPLKIYYGDDLALLPSNDETVMQILPCEHVRASDTLKFLTPMLSQGANANAILADSVSNLLIISDTASNVKRIVKFVKALDKPGQGDSDELVTSVYRINYLDAKSLADSLTNAFKIKSVVTVKSGGVVNDQIIIQPFQDNNTLIVTAIPSVQKAIAATIKVLDKRKRQVLLNVQFLEVTYERNFFFGSTFAFNGGSSSGQVGPTPNANGSNMPSTTTSAAQMAYILNSKHVQMTINDLLENNKVKVLSQPRLLTADNEAATLVVGSQYPILKSTTDLSQNNNTVSDYSYVDIGINLKATPHINPENDVTLDIDFKVSSILEQITMPGGTSGVSTTVPEIGKREVTSTLTVKDGHTLVICGIISQNHTENKSNPAWAGDIPWIGWIFGNESEQRGQTELIVLINPTVVDCPEAEDKLTSSEERKISVKPAEFKDFKRFFEAGKDPRDVLRRESPAPAAAPAPAPGKEADANPKEDPKDKKQGSFFEDLLN